MTTSQKQLNANQKNAKKGGVKTDEGKAISKFNALKHGLLSREIVITAGDGAENPEEFEALSKGMHDQLKPLGTMEEMLVEKIVAAYWRLRRACRYEAGIVQQDMDSTADTFYAETNWKSEKLHKTDEQIDKAIEEEKGRIAYWQKDKRELSQMHETDQSLEEIYDWEENWEELGQKIDDLVPEDYDFEDGFGPKGIREFLNGHAGWTDDTIWKALIEICDEQIKYHKGQIPIHKKQKRENRQKIEVLRKLGNIPGYHELNRLLRYESAIERQFYKALNQLERIQRLRAGDSVPPPLEVNVELSRAETA
ncbi:hypothetical protein ACFL6U_26395 [Planctomycetota bacterium]